MNFKFVMSRIELFVYHATATLGVAGIVVSVFGFLGRYWPNLDSGIDPAWIFPSICFFVGGVIAVKAEERDLENAEQN